MNRALDIANYVILYCLRHNIEITNLKLQKILYFLEANFLFEHRRPLFEDQIEKWKLGPVFPNVYHQFKTFGSTTQYVTSLLKKVLTLTILLLLELILMRI